MVKNREEILEKEEYLNQLEEDLADLERYVEDVISSIPNPFYITNPAGIIIDKNIALEKLTKLKKEELIGKLAFKLFSEEGKYKNLEKTAKLDEKIESKQLNLIIGDETEIPVHIDISIRKNQEGDTFGYIVALRDIRDIKLAEKELQTKVNELKRFNKLAVGRELRMVELKQEVNNLLQSMGHQAKYRSYSNVIKRSRVGV